MKGLKLLKWFIILCGLAVIFIISAQALQRASYKLFWLDESNEIVNSCSASFATLAVHGAPIQCSPSPLYYLLQKSFLTLIGPTTGNILITYRLISLCASFVCLSIIFIFLIRNMGMGYGFAGLLLINTQALFHQFAAENRPYMLWIFLFTSQILLVTWLGSLHKTPASYKFLIFFLALTLALTSSAGMIQAVAALGFFFLVEKGSGIKRWWRSPLSLFMMAAIVIISGVGIYYSSKGCLDYDGGPWDILKTRDWRLVRDVVSLFFPFSGSPMILIFNLPLLVGCVLPFVLWRKRDGLDKAQSLVLSLSTVCLLQLMAAVVIAVLVAQAHYYFIGRAFIYLIILRTFLVVCGLFFIIEKLKKSVHRHQRLLEIGGVITISVMLGWSLYRNHQRLNQYIDHAKTNWPRLSNDLCQNGGGPFLVATETGLPHPQPLNFVVALQEAKKRCPAKNENTVRYIVTKPSADGYVYEVNEATSLPVGAEPVILCGLPTQLE